VTTEVAKLQKISRFALLIQAALWAALLVIFLVVLPRQGFSIPNDFNDPAKLASAPILMSFIAWSDLLFGLTMLVVALVLLQCLRGRIPRLLRALVAIALLGAVFFFIAHDLGLHFIGWPAIASDPASTNYAKDRVLWGYRNGLFLAVGFLTLLVTHYPMWRRQG
jgi:hypothetical protein